MVKLPHRIRGVQVMPVGCGVANRTGGGMTRLDFDEKYNTVSGLEPYHEGRYVLYDEIFEIDECPSPECFEHIKRLESDNERLKEREEALVRNCAKANAEIDYIRKFLWLNHGHKSVYGDDGEMQCSACMPNWNYKEMDIETVVRVAVGSLLEQIAVLTAEKTLWKATAGDEAEGLESWKKEAETLTARIKELEEKIDKLTCIAYEAEEYVNAQVMLRILTAQKEEVK
jgi:cell division protein FtsB